MRRSAQAQRHLVVRRLGSQRDKRALTVEAEQAVDCYLQHELGTSIGAAIARPLGSHGCRKTRSVTEPRRASLTTCRCAVDGFAPGSFTSIFAGPRCGWPGVSETFAEIVREEVELRLSCACEDRQR